MGESRGQRPSCTEWKNPKCIEREKGLNQKREATKETKKKKKKRRGKALTKNGGYKKLEGISHQKTTALGEYSTWGVE